MSRYDYIDVDNMTGMNRYLFDMREKRMERYRDDPDDLRSRINGEVQTRDDYAGREILELLQNAVDASYEGGRIVVELNGDILRVCNDGEPFTQGGIDSILLPNLSPKNEYENLGNKGLGFRSLLNDAEYITIRSRDLSMRMGRKDALEYKKLNGMLECPPVLSVPRVIELSEEQDFVTVIECKLRDEASVAKMVEQIERIDGRSIIFLPKIAEIYLNINGKVRIIRRDRRGRVCEVEEITENDTTVTKYYTAQKTIKGVKTGEKDDDGREIVKDAHITIARDVNDIAKLNGRWGYLYNAFPTKVTMPTGWIVNANFALNADRNDINEKPYNLEVLKGVVDLMFEEAERIAARKYGFEALETLMGDYEKFDFSFAGETIKDYFMEKLERAKILPGVNRNYLALADEPYFYERNLTKYLSGSGFENTVAYCENSEVDEFMKRYSSTLSIGYYRMEPSQISELINNRLDDMMISAQVELSRMFMDEYDDLADVKPNFFLDRNGVRIDYRSEKYTGGESSVARNVPAFLNIKFVDKKFIDEARRQTNTTAKDFENSSYAKYYEIKQYRLLNIAETYKKRVEGNPRRAQRYLYWLYQNEVPSETICGDGLNRVVVPTKNGGEVAVSDGILPGGLYEELFPDSLYIVEWFGDNSSEWRQFLLGIGMCDFPAFFDHDFTMAAFRGILSNSSLERIRRLLNSQTWLVSYDDAKSALNSVAWIEYDGKRYLPCQVVLDSEYGKRFDGILGLSEDDAQRYINVKPDILNVLNFSNNISDISASDIYNILSQLPRVDRRGRLAKKIYRALVKESSVETKVLGSAERMQFVTQGKVFCKDKQYHPVEETYYFAQGLLPKAALRGKNLIEVDKKRGAGRVKSLFGVERLEVDFYANKYSSHFFQRQFADALKFIKIGVLSTEKLDLADEARRDIRALKIQLCRQVEVVVDDETRTLENYEFAAQKGPARKYCLKIPESGWSFDEVRYDLQFINAIAEILVMRIGTEGAENNSDTLARIAETRDVQKFIQLQDGGLERYNGAARFMGEKAEDVERLGDDAIYELNKERLKGALDKYEELYLKNLYDKLKDASLDEQAKFETLRNAFLCFWPDDETVLFGEGFDAEKYVCEQFTIREGIENDTGEALWKKASEKYGEMLNNYDDLKSLARFGHLDVVGERLKEHERRAQELRKRVEQPDDGVRIAKIVEREMPPAGSHGGAGGVRRGGFGGGGRNTEYVCNIGLMGQRVVIATLRNKGISVQDQSGEAIRDGSNVNASDSYGYDLSYVDENNVKHCIEVKSHVDRMKYLAIEMTRNEYERACKLSRQSGVVYEIYLVDCLDANKYKEPEIQIFNFRNIESKMRPEEPRKYYYSGD